MLGLGSKILTRWGNTKALVFAIGIGLTLGGTPIAQGAECSNKTPATWLPAIVTSPDPTDRQAIMDLIHSYLWSLDERNIANFTPLFTEDASYETCRGGGAVQIFSAGARNGIVQYIETQFADLVKKMFQTRHVESNTLLHSRDKDKDTVDGKSTLLVSIQRAVEAGIPEYDYTAVLLATFKRSENGWRIAKVIIITDTPEVEERAR